MQKKSRLFKVDFKNNLIRLYLYAGPGLPENYQKNYPIYNYPFMKKIIPVLLLAYMNTITAQSSEFINATDSAKKYIAQNHLKDKHNTLVDNQNVIHIFMFEDGNLLVKGYPTVATERNKFQLHLFVTDTNKSTFLLEYEGNYSPQYDGLTSGEGVRGGPRVIKRIDFAVLGPFTSKLTLRPLYKPKGTSTFIPLTTPPVILISKTIFASIGSGMVYTSLKDPTEIRAIPLPNGDSTLIASDPNGRGMLTIMATFYPSGRNNLLLQDWTFRDRFGIVAGTGIATSRNNFKNFFLGGQFDFAVGGSVVAGVHYGERQKVVGVDYREFTFNQTKFSGNLEQYTRWDFGIFLGIQIDSRIFSKLFPNTPPPAP